MIGKNLANEILTTSIEEIIRLNASADIWEQIFLGRLEPFAATTQGKMKLKGDLGRLSRWYVPFSRLFELFKQVKIK